LVAAAPQEGSSSSSHGSSSKSNEDIVKDTPKSDAEKERVRAERETATAREALVKFGRRHFMQAFWGMMAMDDPDSIMLRFLRARKWNPGAASAMLASCLKWRIEAKVMEIVEKGEEGMDSSPGFINQLRQGKVSRIYCLSDFMLRSAQDIYSGL